MVKRAYQATRPARAALATRPTRLTRWGSQSHRSWRARRDRKRNGRSLTYRTAECGPARDRPTDAPSRSTRVYRPRSRQPATNLKSFPRWNRDGSHCRAIRRRRLSLRRPRNDRPALQWLSGTRPPLKAGWSRGFRVRSFGQTNEWEPIDGSTDRFRVSAADPVTDGSYENLGRHPHREHLIRCWCWPRVTWRWMSFTYPHTQLLKTKSSFYHVMCI